MSDDQKLQKEKLLALGALAGSVAHDLNNLLAGILGHVSYLRLSLPQTITHRESLFAIEDGARRAAMITQQILDYTRGEEVPHCAVDFGQCLTAALAILKGSLGDGITLSCAGLDGNIAVWGAESQLTQLIVNLLVNARDAMPNGGHLHVILTSRMFTENFSIREQELPNGAYAELIIRDSGMGISADVLTHIFQPFFTTKKNRGTGIGLATVDSIVRKYQGAIDVSSVDGQGTEFVVYLPVCASVPKPEARESTKAEEIPRGNERILVVDDEDAVRVVMQRSLEHLGYEVVVAHNGGEAVRIVSESASPFSLIIVDMIMPVMPGDELFYKLREMNMNPRVLIASGYSSDKRTKAMLRDGALGFIQKPFAVEELAQEVRRCLDLAVQV